MTLGLQPREWLSARATNQLLPKPDLWQLCDNECRGSSELLPSATVGLHSSMYPTQSQLVIVPLTPGFHWLAPPNPSDFVERGREGGEKGQRERKKH